MVIKNIRTRRKVENKMASMKYTKKQIALNEKEIKREKIH